MKIIFYALLFLPLFAAAAPEAEWSDDYGKTLHAAAKTNHPVLLDFSATWCGPCQIMARTTLKDPAILQKLESFLKVKVDIDASVPMAEHFGVHAVPTFVVVDADGEELERLTGAADVYGFGQWLNRALSAAALSASRRDAFQSGKETLARQLQASDPRAVEQLLNYNFRPEKYYREFAAEKLKGAAQANPALFLNFLNHEKLAVRILAANLLRAQLGAEFDFDPWANAATRKVVIDKWQARLGVRLP